MPNPELILKEAIAQATAATRSKAWSESIAGWQTVLDASARVDGSPKFHRSRIDAVVQEARQNISIARRLHDIDAYSEQISAYQLSRRQRDGRAKRIAVYTAITGRYDSLRLPHKLDSRLDYILFTDAPIPDSGIFKIKPILYFHLDPTRSARFVKTHPHTLLSEYDVAIWIDSNIMILGDINPLIEDFLASNTPIAAVPHPLRTSVREECDECIDRDKDDAAVMREQIARYAQSRFKDDDLIESNLLLFDLSKPALGPLLDAWWAEIDRYSRRDQLSLPYVIDNCGVSWHRITERPNSVRNHPEFSLVAHDGGGGPAGQLLSALQSPAVDPFAGPSYAEVRGQRILAQRNRKIDIVVCVHNALGAVRRCLDSIRHARKGENQTLIIIDDGSNAETAAYLRSFADELPWATVHRHAQARGYTRAANDGLSKSTGELVILLNSDTIVTDGWAEKLADAAFSSPSIGIVGPLSNAASRQSIPDYRTTAHNTAINDLPRGKSIEDMNRFCEAWTAADALPRVPFVHGFCLGVARAVIDRIGLLDAYNFPRGYGEETDYCLRASDSGFTLAIATHTYIFHEKTASYSSDVRKKLADAGVAAQRRIYGRERIRRSLMTLEKNPLLERIRERTRVLYETSDIASRSRD